jgi:dTDP-4-dehydrorhamnose reductase
MFFKLVAENAGNTECNILQYYSDEFSSLEKRLVYSVIDKIEGKKTFEIEMSYWTDSLKRFLNKR